jgi:hypothetical protein
MQRGATRALSLGFCFLPCGQFFPRRGEFGLRDLDAKFAQLPKSVGNVSRRCCLWSTRFHVALRFPEEEEPVERNMGSLGGLFST